MTRFDWVSHLRKDARDAAKHRVLRNVRYALREERKSNMALAEALKLEDENASLKQQLMEVPQWNGKT